MYYVVKRTIGGTDYRYLEKWAFESEARGAAINKIADSFVYAAAASRPGALNGMINYYRALLRHRDTLDLGDGRIDIPTLMVWGEEDAALGIGCTVGTEQWVPQLELHRLPGVSHWVQQEAPEKVNAIMADWLDRNGG